MADRTLRLSRRSTPKPESEVGAGISEPVTSDEPVGAVEYSESDSSDFVAPDSATPGEQPDSTSSEPGKRKRGRPAGSSSKSKRTEDKETPENLADVLFSVHYMLSQLCDSELLELDEDEAAKLGKAIARVSKFHKTSLLSPRQLAWVQLGIAGGTVYGPRIVAYSRMQRAKKNKGKITVLDPTPAPAPAAHQPETIER